MKILQINAVNQIGSTGRTCSELSDYLWKRGHECYTAYSAGISSEHAKCVSPVWECKYHALMSRITGLQGYFSVISTRNILRWIEEINPDVVHLRNLHANFLNMKILLEYLADNNIATVITLHDCWFFTGKCTHYTEQKCYKWKTGCENCPKLKTDNKSWFFDRTSKMWSDKKKNFEKIPRLAVVGVSDWLTNEARESILKSAQIIQRIYNWIDLSTFKQREVEDKKKKLKIEEKFIILGVASDWNNKKGLDSFIELAEQIEKDTIIMLVGNLTGYTLPENIIHIDATNSVEELAKYYSMADVFIQLSLEETFGKVVAESLACGTPVITIDSTANAELVGEGCGIVVEEKNITEIARAVCKVKKNKKVYYSSSCRKFAEENFNMERKTEEYIDLYEKLLKQR